MSNMSIREQLGQDPLYLMDGTAFIYRGFYANRTLQRSDGYPTNALYMTARILLRILRQEKPSHFMFVMDGKGPNFRHELFPLYKAHRDATPEELVQQLAPITRMVQALGLPLEVTSGCEADDCIASLAARFSATRPVVIIGADKDLRQCLNPRVLLWDPAAKEEKLLSEADFTAHTGLRPQQWPDVQALTGDSSDNIPGVPGIGPKTAEKIFTQYDNLEDLCAHLAILPPKIRDKIAPHQEAIFVYRQLTRLRLDLYPHMELTDFIVHPPDSQDILGLLHEFELSSLIREVQSLLPTNNMPMAKTHTEQQQPNLLPLASPDTGYHYTPCPTIDTLPACAGLPLSCLPTALLPRSFQHPGCLLTVGQKECLYTGDMTELMPWLRQSACIITPDVKFCITQYPCLATLPPAQWFDLGLAAYVLQPEERDYSWPRLSSHYATVLVVAPQKIGSLALAMCTALEGQLAEHDMDALYYDIEMPLIFILAAMEQEGIAVDVTAFQDFLTEVQTKLQALTAQIYEAAGGPFNIRSAQQLGEVLFRSLELPTAKKTQGGQFSTAQTSLESLAGHHPVVDLVLEYRKLEKMRSTYLEPLPRLVDSRGRIHTTFHQMTTATGRLSSSNPNLQNIPVRGSLGQRMRRCFIAKVGHSLISADYSQVELRVLAHMSGDPVLLQAFHDGKDIHTSTAALIYAIPLDAVQPEQRRTAKTINFGLIYGMGAQKLAQELKISTPQAKEFINNYFAKLHILKEYYDTVEHDAKEHGYVTTLAGRRRSLPDIHSSNGQASALARRQAINTVIQGSAADIIKIAMLTMHTNAELQQCHAKLILQVHDELLLEAPVDQATRAASVVTHIMTHVAPLGHALRVPLLVDTGIGQHWGEAH